MKKPLMTIALLGGALLGQSDPLANGIYAVEQGNAKAKSRVVRQYEGGNVVLDASNFAPLTIVGKPQLNRDERGSSLTVQLAPEAARRLEDLTRSHIHRPIAVVVGDRILAAPTVRSVIKDGKALLTPCEDESCQALLRQLTK